jgi:RpiB/LacA/LacB family sugar-phosphate isomerase
MRIVVGSDHAGFPLKETVLQIIREEGHEVVDVGTNNTDPVDYPDFTYKLGKTIQRGDADRGIMLCGSGIGACISANKMKGIYASVVTDTYSAHQGVEHDDLNVLCLGARITGVEPVKEIVRAFLRAQFSDEERHHRRVAKVRKIEADEL